MSAALALVVLLSVSTPSAGEPVRITTPGGAVLSAHYLDAGPGSPGVLFFPMCRADAMDGWSPVAERLRAAGISSLTLTYRGYGESRGGGESGDQRGNDADAAFAYLRSRTGASAPLAVAGSSCGVAIALMAASRHPADVRAAVALTGPHTASQLAHVRATPGLAIFSGAADGDTPAPDWARELRQASQNGASKLQIFDGREHGTDILPGNTAAADAIAEWLRAQLLRR